MFPLTETPGFFKTYTPSLADSLQPGPKAETMFLPRESVEEKGKRFAHSNQRRAENNEFSYKTPEECYENYGSNDNSGVEI